MIDWVRSRPWLGDLALVVVVLAAELPGVGTVRSLLITLACAGLVALGRRYPVPVVALVGVLFLLGAMPPGYDTPGSAMIIALFLAGRHAPALAAATAALGAAAVSGVLNADVLVGHPPAGVTMTLFPMLPVTAGHVVGLRAELARRGREQAAERAVREERRRIARELHDVIAHHVSVVSLYMGAARRLIPTDGERARQALLTGEDTARQAMTEMRHMLEVLRTDGEKAEGLAGVGAAGLPALVGESRDAALEITGEAVPLPAPVDHAVYRIVQEALTNTRKHATGAASRVRLAYLPGRIEVEVSDDGRGASGGPGLGLGLAGMAERVSLVGGELKAGPATAGGFLVRARIPLPERT
ncbi:sensor histidine kinase [Nonomuraea sp. NPDC050394]|uniref:sensor histidine kinase n=1 Tax=Nonomuraea sp. NPDC050394 TaxID=3364363 RepID=UPI0037A5898C